eukprot:Mycagemm_TRINITY_DN10298_c1_g4::TRINITY_DN10298_c1_g4_i1::g.4225::m.4225 type:complete len:102 gc:universal TRINITY_DN10298_c1_g4_i1:1224-1529(+)
MLGDARCFLSSPPPHVHQLHVPARRTAHSPGMHSHQRRRSSQRNEAHQAAEALTGAVAGSRSKGGAPPQGPCAATPRGRGRGHRDASASPHGESSGKSQPP